VMPGIHHHHLGTQTGSRHHFACCARLPVCSSQQWRWWERSQYQRDPASLSARRLVSSSRHPNPNLRTSFHSPLTFFPSPKLTEPPSPNLLDEPNFSTS
jgi:hypothetical protein